MSHSTHSKSSTEYVDEIARYYDNDHVPTSGFSKWSSNSLYQQQKYKRWKHAYNGYNHDLYDIIYNTLNLYKVTLKYDIRFSDFEQFIYINSTKSNLQDYL